MFIVRLLVTGGQRLAKIVFALLCAFPYNSWLVTTKWLKHSTRPKVWVPSCYFSCFFISPPLVRPATKKEAWRYHKHLYLSSDINRFFFTVTLTLNKVTVKLMEDPLSNLVISEYVPLALPCSLSLDCQVMHAHCRTSVEESSGQAARKVSLILSP